MISEPKMQLASLGLAVLDEVSSFMVIQNPVLNLKSLYSTFKVLILNLFLKGFPRSYFKPPGNLSHV